MIERSYHLIETIAPDGTVVYKTYSVQSTDQFTEPLEIIVFDLKILYQIAPVLQQFDLVDDVDYFFKQCREVISVPEKHINDKGEGKLSFQSYFHNFPHSVLSINHNAQAVIAMHPSDKRRNGLREFHVVGYIHINLYELNLPSGEKYDGVYYNLLRISERTEEGKKIYRGKKVFSLMFAVMHSLAVEISDRTMFGYGAMGKENQSINEALRSNTGKFNKHFEKWAFRNNTKINLLFGSRSASEKLIDISTDIPRLKEMYQRVVREKGHHVFFHINTEEEFFSIINKILEYSKTTRVYMIADDTGNMKSACVAMNWGDYFQLTLENPKGLFKMIANLKLTDQVLYPYLLVGDPADAEVLLKGIAYKYRKDHKVQLTLLNSFDGDPYYEIKKSIIYDDYLFLVICNSVPILTEFKERSKAPDGHVKLFIDIPLM